MLTQERLKELYDYCPMSGSFILKRDGSVKGLGREGYVSLRIDGKDYQAHRLVFLFIEGVFPENDVDHVNMVRSDNRWENLRKCSRSENMKNISAHKDNRLGIKNVFYRKDTGKYSVRLTTPSGYKNYGCFDSLEFAELVAIEARNKFHGEYARHI